jgi:DNA-binding NarL/FixJ family response regulator
MDKVNGKDFFKEFDRKKDEMFSLIQDSEEMVHELNRMSDYVVTVISEKNKEFINKNTNLYEVDSNIYKTSAQNSKEIKEIKELKEESKVNGVNEVIEVNALKDKVQEAQIIPNTDDSMINERPETTTTQNKELGTTRTVNMQFSNNNVISNKDLLDKGKSKLVLNSSRREVLQLIEQGLSNDEIADKLKIGKGEIGLIRGLNR